MTHNTITLIPGRKWAVRVTGTDPAVVEAEQWKVYNALVANDPYRGTYIKPLCKNEGGTEFLGDVEFYSAD